MRALRTPAAACSAAASAGAADRVTRTSIRSCRSSTGIDFGAPDGPARLIFLIAAPEGGDSDHLKILAALARRLVRQSFKDTLLGATDAQQVADYITQEVTV